VEVFLFCLAGERGVVAKEGLWMVASARYRGEDVLLKNKRTKLEE
jgi:hypothetical protein